MARYIDFDKIDTEKAYKRNEIYYRDSFKSGVVSTLHLLAKMTSADVEEVKHAEWRSVVGDVIFACSNCDAEVSTSWDYENDDMFAYCPCCGAKMDGTPKERGWEK